MTAREYVDVRKEFFSSTFRNNLVEGAKSRMKFHRDAASYESAAVKAASILVDTIGTAPVVAAVAEACLAELNRRAKSEADGHDEAAAALREAIKA